MGNLRTRPRAISNGSLHPLTPTRLTKEGLTYQELAEATGAKEGTARFALPPGLASALRPFPGFEHYGKSK
eukprot:7550932-Pyramimonas_sp.AAC.1